MVPPGLSFSLLPFMVRKLSCYVSVFSLFPNSCLDPVNKSQGTGVSPGNEASPTMSSHTLLQTNEVAGGAYQTIWKLFVYSHHSWSILSLLAHRCSINSISLFTSMSEKKKKMGLVLTCTLEKSLISFIVQADLWLSHVACLWGFT